MEEGEPDEVALFGAGPVGLHAVASCPSDLSEAADANASGRPVRSSRGHRRARSEVTCGSDAVRKEEEDR